MLTQRLILALAAFNVVLLVLVATAYIRPGAAQTLPVLRGRELQLVDDLGRVRASIKLEPAGTAAGVTYAETVILRLIDQNGRPTVKIAGSVEGGGMSIVGDTDQTYLILKAEPTGSSLTLLQKDARRTVLGP